MQPERVLLSCILLALLVIGSLFTGAKSLAQPPQRLVVSSNGPFETIEAALEAAQDGDTIEVQGGTYRAPVIITKSISLIGIDQPVIDGRGEGSLVYVQAPDVVFRGFTVRNTGTVQHREDSGIIIEAPRALIEDNRFENVLYGIFFANAQDGIARRNYIYGVGEDEAMRGDGIRVWYSDDVHLIENHVVHSRDTLIWYSDNLIIADNIFEDSRYGLHFMYNNDAVVSGNTFKENSVGAFLMYSIGATFTDNIFAYNRGPSGYGLALKDMDNVTAENNFFSGNRAGLYLDNSPALVDNYNLFKGNVFAYNDIGVTALPAVQRNIFTENSFLDNLQQVAMRGREIVSRNVWTHEGHGNYWSDYAGYDSDGDGFGEAAYQADRLFESLNDTNPNLQLFAYSPAAQAIEFVASAFPVLRPQPRLIDNAPMLSYHFPAYLESSDKGVSDALLFSSLMMLIVGVLGFHAALKRRSTPSQAIQAQSQPAPRSVTPVEHIKGTAMIKASNLTKRYGTHVVLDDVSFDIQRGESVALWGTNGAGKTTTIRCLLGVIPFDGELIISGVNVRKDGKAARALIGYIPQEAAFYDMTVWQTLKFYADLKSVPEDKLPGALQRAGLEDHTNKRVPALSGGLKQRLALAISLLSDPPILILDEPTANLDVQSRHDFLELVQQLNEEGKTIIFSTHRIDEVAALASRVLVLQGSNIVVDCSPDELITELGLNQWLRLQVPHSMWSNAVQVLAEAGYDITPNGQALYLRVNGAGKMKPLRMLAAANIVVEDFDLVDHNLVPVKDNA